MSLSKRFKRALDRENIAISLNQSRNKRVIRKAFEESSGNTITDTIVSLVKKGLRAQRKDERAYREDEPENWKQHLQDGVNMDKSKLVEFIEKHFDVEDKDLSDKSESYLKGYLVSRLSYKGINTSVSELEERGMDFLEGLAEKDELAEDSQSIRASGKAEEAREALKNMHKGLSEAEEQIGEAVENEDLDKAEKAREKLQNMHEGA